MTTEKAFGQQVVFTFDDGPHDLVTPIVLDCLAEFGAKAVFFVLGNRMSTRASKVILRRVVAEGHRIGNHSLTHADLTQLSWEGVRREIAETGDRIVDIAGSVNLFRPPYGRHNPIVGSVTRELGYKTVFWDVDSRDWKFRPGLEWPATTAREATIRVNSGKPAVVLLHDIHRSTAQGLPILFRQLGSVVPQAPANPRHA